MKKIQSVVEIKITAPVITAEKHRLYAWASALALFTICYNVVEGLVSVYFGLQDETMALFGFGLDSFVEVISGVGIWHMVMRLRQSGNESPDRFEQRALRITGSAFYLLALGLAATAAINLISGHRPETAFWGIVVSLVSIAFMWLLIHYKVRVGTRLDSQAILADANCSKACLYLSVALLIASAAYELTGIGGIDSIGALFIAGFSIKEGREAFDKARGKACGCGGAANITIDKDGKFSVEKCKDTVR